VCGDERTFSVFGRLPDDINEIRYRQSADISSPKTEKTGLEIVAFFGAPRTDIL